MDHNELFVYKRHYQGATWLVIANFSKESVALPDDLNIDGEYIVQNGEIQHNILSGFGAVVIAQ